MPSQATKPSVYEGKRVKIYSNLNFLGVEEKEIDVSPQLGGGARDSGAQYAETIYFVFKLNPQHESLQQHVQASRSPSGVVFPSNLGEEEIVFVNLLLPTIQESLSLGKFGFTGSWAGLTAGSLTWSKVELPESLFIEYQISDIKKFADFFVDLASKIPEVIRILAEKEQDAIDIFTVFDSQDEKIYDLIYQLEQRTFAYFPKVNADFHAVNLKDFDKSPSDQLIPSTTETLFFRS